MEDFGLFVSFLLVLAIVIAVLSTPFILLDRASCNRISSDSRIKTEYRLIGGCYVEVNNRLIPKENWRGEYQQ